MKAIRCVANARTYECMQKKYSKHFCESGYISYLLQKKTLHICSSIKTENVRFYDSVIEKQYVIALLHLLAQSNKKSFDE